MAGEEPLIQYLWGAETDKTVTINETEYKLDFSGITFNKETVAVWGDGDINATLTGDAIVVYNYSITSDVLDGTSGKNSAIKTANGSTITILDGVTFTINANVKITAGKNETPPKRGIIPWCTLRSFGISNKCFLNEINKILGIMNMENPKLIKNDNNNIGI